MKKVSIAFALLLASLLAGRARAQVCGSGYGGGPTFDVTGNWAYAWPVRSDLTYHGTMTLVGCNGYITGSLGLPVEVTDPNIIARWNAPVYGTESAGSVMLFAPPGNGSGNDDPWFFELIQTSYHILLQRPNGGALRGEEFAGAEHYDRNAIFSAIYIAGQPNRAIVTGAVTPCPTSTPPTVAGNYGYSWDAIWSGQMQLSQSGPWVWGNILPPIQLPPDQQATWNWPFWGGILTSDGTLFIISGPGVGYTDPWWFNLTESGIFVSGSAYEYTCHNGQGGFSIERE